MQVTDYTNQYQIIHTMRTASHPCYTALSHNKTCTARTANHPCYTALSHNKTCTARTANHTCYTALSHNITCTVRIPSHPCYIAVSHNTTCTVQNEIFWSCPAVQHIMGYTPQIALPCGVTGPVQIGSHQFWNAVMYAVQTANHHFCAAGMHNATCTLQFACCQCSTAMPYHCKMQVITVALQEHSMKVERNLDSCSKLTAVILNNRWRV